MNGTPTGTDPATQTVATDQTLPLPGKAYTLTGYEMIGWSLDPATVTGRTVYGVTDPYVKKGSTNLTFYVVWQPVAKQVNYVGNGADGGSPVGATPYTFNTAVTLASNTFTRTGYTFIGWDESATSTTPAYATGGGFNGFTAQYPGTSATGTTVYAIWKANSHTLIYDANGGTGSQSDPIDYDQTVTVNNGSGFSYVGYTHEGWSKTPTGGLDYPNGSSYTHKQDADVTLYAVWNYDSTTLGVTYDGNGGTPGVQNTKPVTYKSPVPLPAEKPTRLAYKFTGWYKDAAMTQQWIFTTDTMPPTDLILYAGWERTDWVITFDVNGGDATSLPTYILVPITNTATEEGTANLDIYLPGGTGEPYYLGNSYLGLTEDVAGWTVVTQGNFSLNKNLLVVANWTTTSVTPTPNPTPNPTPTSSSTPASLPYEIPAVEPGDSSGTGKDTVNPGYEDSMGDPVYGTYSNIAGSGVYVTYKDESTVAEVENNLTAQASYTDLYGTVYTLDVHTQWNTGVLHDGGVELIEFYTVDNRGATITSDDCYGTVFVLNRPYIRANDVHYIFEGEGVTGDEYNPYAYAEVPILSQGRIARIKLPTVFDLMGADTQTAGSYGVGFNATFTDAFGQVFNLHKDSVLVVRTKAKPTKDELVQGESSEFWVKVTEIYHLMKPGQVIEINDLNFKDGGRLLDEEIPADAGYDRLIKVTPNPYVYMNPCILDRIRVDKEGEMQVFLSGRTLTFNSKDYQTNPERSYEPKGYFDLRMGVNKNEKITQLVGADTPQMQLRFEMNRAWYAEPYFTIKVNEEMRALGEAGSTLYLFNYNPDTNELEMIGPMIPVSNGDYRIQVKGIYKDYVILAGLPQGANYRITDRTNTLGSGTLGEIGQNYVDSGKAKTIDEGLNAANVTYQRISGDGTFDSLGEYEATTGNKISTQKNSKILPITIGSITGLALLAGGGYLFYKKKKHLDD